MQIKPGEILAERFEIISDIGVGGFSRVFLVKDRKRNNEEVALKLFADNTGLDTQTLKEVEKEYENIKGLEHPNILAPYAFGTIENVPYLAMEYAKGGNLAYKMRSGEILKWNEESKLEMIKQVLEGLSYLHKEKVVHHDLKPENIVISNGVYKIIDFGLSERTKSSIKKSLKTISEKQLKKLRPTQSIKKEEKRIKGYSPGYVSPERYEELKKYKSPEIYTNKYEVNEKSDIFAFGVLLYEMFEEVSPWGGEGGIAFSKLMQLPELRNKSKYSVKIYKLIKSSLAYNPEKRHSAKKILEILEKPERNKNNWVYGMVGLIVIIAFGLGVYFGRDWKEDKKEKKNVEYIDTIFMGVNETTKKENSENVREEHTMGTLSIQKKDQQNYINMHSDSIFIKIKKNSLHDYVLNEKNLEGYSKSELRIIRNYFFARHNYNFNSVDLKVYFKKFYWYEEKYDNVNSKLTKIDKRNINLIKEVEKK